MIRILAPSGKQASIALNLGAPARTDDLEAPWKPDVGRQRWGSVVLAGTPSVSHRVRYRLHPHNLHSTLHDPGPF